MTTQHDKWQFGLKHLLGWMALVAIFLAIPPPVAGVICIFAFGWTIRMLDVGEGRAEVLPTIVCIACFVRFVMMPSVVSY